MGGRPSLRFCDSELQAWIFGPEDIAQVRLVWMKKPMPQRGLSRL